MSDSRIAAMHIANFFDGTMTAMLLTLGYEEANPTVRMLWDYGYGPYSTVKFLLVAIAIEFLDRHLRGRARSILTILLGVLGAVVCWHLSWLVFSLSR